MNKNKYIKEELKSINICEIECMPPVTVVYYYIGTHKCTFESVEGGDIYDDLLLCDGNDAAW